tara:strand:+ start:381 stop:1091 length:711 start_codon:yes stop_codon:yes gene_type:complete
MKKGLAIQQLINESNLAISEICDLLNVSRFIVHKWRSGDSNPRRENLNKLAEINKVKLKWAGNNDVLIEPLNAVNDKQISAGLPLEDIISNQLELIDILKKENSGLKNNINKFRLSKKIINDHDYSFERRIDSGEIVKIDLPADGLLGYSKEEFVKLSKLWPDSPLFSKNDQKYLSEFEKVRFELAETLNIAHFDISDHILYRMKDKGNKWGYFIKYYDLEMNLINTYVKFLDFVN